MNTIEKAVSALLEKNSAALASCFAPGGVYIDYCPAVHGREGFFIYGRDGIEIFFRHKFLAGEVEIAEPEIENDRGANYFASYGGAYVFSRFGIEAIDDSGLIKKAVVHPI